MELWARACISMSAAVLLMSPSTCHELVLKEKVVLNKGEEGISYVEAKLDIQACLTEGINIYRNKQALLVTSNTTKSKFWKSMYILYLKSMLIVTSVEAGSPHPAHRAN